MWLLRIHDIGVSVQRNQGKGPGKGGSRTRNKGKGPGKGGSRTRNEGKGPGKGGSRTRNGKGCQGMPGPGGIGDQMTGDEMTSNPAGPGTGREARTRTGSATR